MDLLCREIAAVPAGDVAPAPLRTVFFGGGTPSLLPHPLLLRVLAALRDKFSLAPDAEISMEMDPGTFDAARLREVREAGVSRVSVGVQAFDDALLKSCGRAHSLADTREALALLAAERAEAEVREHLVF